MAQERLCGCASSSKHSLYAYAINTKISYAGSNNYFFLKFSQKNMSVLNCTLKEQNICLHGVLCFIPINLICNMTTLQVF